MKNSGSKVTLYCFTALFPPQHLEALTETVKNRFCSINPPITAVLRLLSALSAGSGATAARVKDSRASRGPSAPHSQGEVKSPTAGTHAPVGVERQREHLWEEPAPFTSFVSYFVLS